MTAIEKEKIRYLRSEGLGYKAIASRLGVSVSAVKGFCQRNSLNGAVIENMKNICRQCGKPLEVGRKKFCSDRCRSTWWSNHTYLYQYKEEDKRACAHCGCVFYSFKSKRRKYCCHPCYIAARSDRSPAEEEEKLT